MFTTNIINCDIHDTDIKNLVGLIISDTVQDKFREPDILAKFMARVLVVYGDFSRVGLVADLNTIEQFAQRYASLIHERIAFDGRTFIDSFMQFYQLKSNLVYGLSGNEKQVEQLYGELLDASTMADDGIQRLITAITVSVSCQAK